MEFQSDISKVFSRPLTMADLIGNDEINAYKKGHNNGNNNSKDKNFFSASSKCKP